MKFIVSIAIVAMTASCAFAQETTDGEKAAQEKSDHLQIAVQKICPVMGTELGSMGKPIKVQIGDQVAFLCCKGCQDKPVKKEHWETIQVNLAKAQGTCPVMGKKVDASMKSAVVNGRKIFVCCPPCIEKIEADPKTFVAKLDTQFAAYLKSKEKEEASDAATSGEQTSNEPASNDTPMVDGQSIVIKLPNMT